jgi:SAM-dependent methyltransferase
MKPGSPVQVIREDAKRLSAHVSSQLAKDFLKAADRLPAVKSQTVYFDREKKQALTEDEAKRLDESARAGLKEIKVDEQFYYNTRYGTPLAYAHALDIAAAAGLKSVRGRRVLDFGYGSIGQLKLLAFLGADVVGVEVDPVLEAAYGGRADQSPVGPADGRVTLVHGNFPGNADVRQKVGADFDLIISKNVLKHGYIHPARPVDPRMTIDLGVTDREFVKAVFESVKPGGFFLIYNLCPAPSPSDKPYIPWSDGRCPFAREVVESEGFRVIAYNEDASTDAREMGRLLRWADPPSSMDLKGDLFCVYTLLQRPAER